MQESLESRHADEIAFRKRFDHLEFVGAQERYSELDMTPKIADPCAYFSEYLDTRPTPIPNFDPTTHVFCRSNSLVQLNHLDRFNRPKHALRPEHRDVVAVAASYVDALLALSQPLPFPTVSDLADVRFYGSKFAGIEYARLGLKTRREADSRANDDAERAWLQLMSGERVVPQLNRIGGRGKMAKRADFERMGDKLDKGRLVMMTGHRDLKLNGVTEQLLTNAYKADRKSVV